MAFKPKTYTPKANFATPLDWSSIVATVAVNSEEGNYDTLSWPPELEGRLEKDLFDESFVEDTLTEFVNHNDEDEFAALLPRLSFMALAGMSLSVRQFNPI